MKLCLDCGRHVQTSEARNARCPDCRRTHEREKSRRRRKTAARGYDGAWRKLVAEAIKRQPFCTYCGTRGSKANPLTGDHRIPLSKGGTARTLADVVVACRSCNSSRGGGVQGNAIGARYLCNRTPEAYTFGSKPRWPNPGAGTSMGHWVLMSRETTHEDCPRGSPARALAEVEAVTMKAAMETPRPPTTCACRGFSQPPYRPLPMCLAEMWPSPLDRRGRGTSLHRLHFGDRT
jgi:5-methylcytosine-specific restriction endonuclease McrA